MTHSDAERARERAWGRPGRGERSGGHLECGPVIDTPVLARDGRSQNVPLAAPNPQPGVMDGRQTAWHMTPRDVNGVVMGEGGRGKGGRSYCVAEVRPRL